MSEYKRLTERYIDEQGINCVRGLAWDGEILHRLAELEDKIENGTLVELPCKVGDKIYRAMEFVPLFSENCLWTVLDWEIVKVEIYQEEILFYDDADNEIRLEDFGKTIFLTESEAEKKLEELKNE